MKRREFFKRVVCTSVLAAGNFITAKTEALAEDNPETPQAYSTAEAGPLDRATFDFYVEHKTLLAASTSEEAERTAEFEIFVNPISFNPNEISLKIVPIDVPEKFTCTVAPEKISIRNSGGVITCKAIMPAGIEEGREALFKLVGTRSGEEEETVLRVKACTALPRLQLGHSKTKVAEQPLKVTAGAPVQFHLSLANCGHLADEFEISTAVSKGWLATVKDNHLRPIRKIRVRPVQGIFQWENPEDIWLEISPADSATPKKAASISVRARSMRTGAEDEIKVNVFLTPPLFSINDLDGLDPRVHYLQAGSLTTYVLRLFNPTRSPRKFNLKLEGLPPDWTASLPKEPLVAAPLHDKEVLLKVTAPRTVTKGELATFTVSAEDSTGDAGAVRLAAEICDLPKIYFLVVDSLDYAYLTLNRNGDGPGSDGDWLCPNIRAFLADGCSFSNAHCGMPAATDMNHTTILSGATTGTTGAYWVSGLYAGTDATGEIIVVRPNPDILRHGRDGKKLLRIFDLVKQQCPSARSVVVSNKAWVSTLHEDGDAVQWGITGSHFPVYATPPPPFVLGDPPTDENRRDRAPVKPPELMVNLQSLDLMPQVLHGDFELLRPAFLDIGRYIGGKPGFFPDDAWISKTVRQVIREEDPDVLYANLAAVDEAGHVFGAAWDPDEWSKANGFFNSYSVSKYSDQARRGEILDVVREADSRLGEILNELRERGVFDSSIIVFAADHSMITEGYRKQGYAAIDLREYLRSQGIIPLKHYGTTWSLNHYAAIFDVRDEQTLKEIKRQLQGLTVDDPVHGKGFHPCIVLDEEGMRTGVDADNPFLSAEEKKVAEAMELYSAYYIENDAGATSVRWPHLFIFFRSHYQGTVPGDAVIKGVNGVGERMPVFRRTGSRWVGIHGSEGTTHVPLLFCGPAVRKGVEVEQPAALHDIVPTLCRMLGMQAPETAAGKVREEILNP